MSSQLVSHTDWFIYPGALLLAAALSAFLYWRNPKLKETPKFIRTSLFLLRSLSFFLLFLMLCDLYFRTLERRDEKPLLLLAIDNSQSMVLAADSLDVRQFCSKTIPVLKDELMEKFEIREMTFGEKVNTNQPVIDFREKESDFESLFQDLENKFGNRNVAGLVLLSDGLLNKGASPVNTSNSLGFPVYCLGSGDSTEKTDLSITKIAHNQVVYLGNDFPVDVVVTCTRAKGKQVWVKIHQKGKELARQTLNIPSEHYTGTLHFTLNAGSTGLSVYEASVEVLDEEINPENNRMEFVLEVQDKRQNILLLAAAPHPDIAALRESILSAQSYSLDLRFTDNFSGPLNAYNLVVFHGIGSEQQRLVDYCRENKVPFWIVRPNSSEIFPGLRLNGNSNRFNDSEPLINEDFSLFRVRPELSNFLEGCPAVKCFFGRHLTSNSSMSLLRQKIGNVETTEPLLLFNEVDGLKAACFNGDGLWKWKMRDYAEHGTSKLFDELISSTLLFLSAKSDKSQFRLRYPKVLYENTAFYMEAEVYNRSYETVTNAEVTLSLRSNDNKVYPYTFSNNGHYYEALPGNLAPGEYRFTAKARYGQEFLEKEGRFIVKASNYEQINLHADHNMLRQLAFKSGGEYFNFHNSEALKDLLLTGKKFKTVSFATTRLLKPVEIMWLFVLLLLLLSLEWILRKKHLRI